MPRNATTLPANSIFPVRLDQQTPASYRDLRQSATLQCRNVAALNADIGQGAHVQVNIATHGDKRTRETGTTFALAPYQCRALAAELLGLPAIDTDDIASELAALQSHPDARMFPHALALLMTILHKRRP